MDDNEPPRWGESTALYLQTNRNLYRISSLRKDYNLAVEHEHDPPGFIGPIRYEG